MTAEQTYRQVWPAGFSYMQLVHMQTHAYKTAERNNCSTGHN